METEEEFFVKEKLEFTKQEIDEKFEMWDLPEHMKDGVYNYLNYGIPPGGFMEALLTNNLFMAVGKADCDNIEKLPEWVGFLYNDFPLSAWGSREDMQRWIDSHRE